MHRICCWWLKAVLVAGFSVYGLSGCQPPKPPPPPAVLDAMVIVSSDVNPDPYGRPSPVVLRFYELRARTAFDSVGFFDIYEGAEQALAAELVGWGELALMPGETRPLKLTLHPDTQHVGLIVGYRALEDARWRTMIAVAAHQTTIATIELNKLAVSVSGP